MSNLRWSHFLRNNFFLSKKREHFVNLQKKTQTIVKRKNQQYIPVYSLTFPYRPIPFVWSDKLTNRSSSISQ